jgi:hypothetical protein
MGQPLKGGGPSSLPQHRQGLLAADGSVLRPGVPFGLPVEGRAEHRLVFPPRHLDGAELGQVLGDELGVEQREAAKAQPRDEVSRTLWNMLSPKKAEPSFTP